MPGPRVVSLLPSATEMVCAVGRRASLVGVSHECDWPPEVVGVPVLTSTKVLPSRSSGAIDRDVRRVLRDALAVYDVDVAGLADARPDVIVTQDLCDVCAVSFNDVQRAVDAIARPGIRVVNLHPTRLADIWSDLRRVGAALDADDDAARAVAGLLERVEDVRRRAEEAAARSGRPKVLTIEWLDPVMVGGTWMPELVALAGGEPLVTEPGQHAPTLDPKALSALAPEVVLIKPCGFDLERTFVEAQLLHDLLASFDWPACRSGRVWVADGNAYFNRPGPRIVDSLELLAACIHPETFPDHAARYAAATRRLPVSD